MSTPKIPIENIYYLFSYAWNRFDEAQSIPLGGTQSPDLPNLLAKVLLYGTRALMRRGLDRGYQPYSESISTVRGHIELGPSLQLQARNVRKLHCEYDELSHDLLHNRILKASLNRLARAPMVERAVAQELKSLARQMPGVTDMKLERSAFSRVQLHRHNGYYNFLLKIAELAFDCLLPDPKGGGYAFHDVLRDEKKMAAVFESFVRNFYRAEQQDFAVEPLTISWDAVTVKNSGIARLPGMRVDVFLKNKHRRIIIDTKYYANALQTFYGSESFRSDNLYQVFAYLKNAAGSDASFGNVEGILLYPCAGRVLDDAFFIQGHLMTIATVDLTLPWREIHSRLLNLIGRPEMEIIHRYDYRA